MEHLPEEPDGGMVRPVLPFVFSALNSGERTFLLLYLLFFILVSVYFNLHVKIHSHVEL